jgi:hypothetical protein
LTKSMSSPAAAREQDAFEGDGAEDAAVQMGEDGGEVGCAEAGCDGVETGTAARWRTVPIRCRP